jgi:hypothetical protein
MVRWLRIAAGGFIIGATMEFLYLRSGYWSSVGAAPVPAQQSPLAKAMLELHARNRARDLPPPSSPSPAEASAK